ncbi:MAG: hypothetical protein C0394_02500 [Syntrophus sp. (in: bacteria)]|nr:hypothetical protein [Syntrophus sp. (in: bacteria)]
MGYPDMMRDILEQARREEIAGRRTALENKPVIDQATGLYSREYFSVRLDQEMARSRLYGNRLSLIFVAMGLSLRQDQGNANPVYEKAMKVVAGIIGDCLTDTISLAFHYDQGRFAVIVPEADNQEAALLADHIRKSILEEKIQGITPHAAVVQYKDHENIDDLLRDADDALHGNARG